jgi:L-aspartate oxidase
MPEYHPSAELAPRDVVSRAILTEMAKQDATCMYLSVAHLNIEKFRKRFPSISRLCEQFDIDLATQPIPVRPAAHYMVGGVKVDQDAWTGMPGLFACGEAASSGVHGANRLASNSLLEGLVFGAVAGHNAAEAANGSPRPLEAAQVVSEIEASSRTMLDITDVRNSLQSVMWRNVGIERHGPRLNETVEIISFWGKYVMDKLFDRQIEWETQNMLTVAHLIAIAARERKESRGVHARADYPEINPELDGKHLVLQRQEGKLNVRMEG